MSNCSVVIPTYRRLGTLEEVLKGWLEQTDDVWLADSSNKFETSLPINHVRFNPDPGNMNRHAIALLTHGDFVIKADDDVVPLPGLGEDLVAGSVKNDGIVGIHGRTFKGENYYGDTVCYSAAKIDKPIKVDFVGIITCSPRKYLAFDLKGCLTPIEDVFWQMGAFPNVNKYVVPTRNYRQLLTSEDNNCLFYNKKARKQRMRYCREWYRSMHR